MLKQYHPVPVCTAVRSAAPVSSPFPPLGTDTEGRRAIQSKVGSHSHPNPPKAPLSFPARSVERQASLHRCSLGQDDSLSSAGLSSSCVALRISAGGFPAGHSCSYALNNTGSVVLQTTSFRSAEMNTKMGQTAICAADATDMFIFFAARGS